VIATLTHLRTRLFYGWHGAGMLSRLSGASTLLLGGVAIAGMSLVTFVSSQGWPGALSGPASSPPQLIRLSSPGEGVRQALGGSHVAPAPGAAAPAAGQAGRGSGTITGSGAGTRAPAPAASNEIRSGNGPGLQPGAGHPQPGAGQPQPGPGGGPAQTPGGENPGTPAGGGSPGDTPAPAPSPAPAAQGNGNGHAYGRYKNHTKSPSAAPNGSSSGNGNAYGHANDPSTPAPAEQPAPSKDQGGRDKREG